MTGLFADLVRAWRHLAATPASAAAALVMLALGSGATVALFALFNALVLRPLPLPAPDRLAFVWVTDGRGEHTSLPLASFRTLAAGQDAFDAFAGILASSAIPVGVRGATHHGVVDAVTADYFDVLQLTPAAGRFFDATEVGDGAAAPVAVITHGFWHRAFGADAAAIGGALLVGDAAFTIVGVTPAGFTGLHPGAVADAVIPLPSLYDVLGLPPARPLAVTTVVGRLRNDATLASARAALDALWPAAREDGIPAGAAPEIRAAHAARRLDVGAGAHGRSAFQALYGPPLRLMTLATVWLLVIASVNVAALQLGRTLARRHEIGLARALGATRARVMRPFALEGLLLAAGGLALGAPMAWLGASTAAGMLAPLTLDVVVDARVWMAASATLGGCALVAGVLPAWLSTARHDWTPSSSSRVVRTTSRASTALVVAQVALSLILLAGAATATAALVQVRLGAGSIEGRTLGVATLMNQAGGYTDLDDDAYYRRLLDQVRGVPGVTGAALVKPAPASGARELLLPLARADGLGPADARGAYVMASPGYTELLGVPLLQGRTLADSDARDRPPVAVVSRRVAEDLFGTADPLGRTIRIGTLPQHQSLEIVGVVADARVVDPRTERPPIVYVAFAQQPPPFGRWPAIVVRASANPGALAASIDAVVAAERREFVLRYDTLPAAVDRVLARERLLAALAQVYGLLAAGLVLVGLTSLLGLETSARTRELGVRLAIGATPRHLATRVVSRGLGITAAGLALGAPVAGLLVNAVTPLVGRTDQYGHHALGAGLLLLLVAALAACIGPARHAARVQPADALRCE